MYKHIFRNYLIVWLFLDNLIGFNSVIHKVNLSYKWGSISESNVLI